MDRSDVIGAGEIAAGGYLGYKGIEHGLPRALGIRMEYHTTSKENAALIKKAGNILDPKFGGKNGWAKKVSCDQYVKNSKNFVHITGYHKDSTRFVSRFMRPIQRWGQNMMYKTVGNCDIKELFKASSPKERIKILKNIFINNILKNKTKRFCIPGIDSYFNSNFVPDTDDIALKSTKKLKVYTNRFSAMIAGLKKFGLKGIKENKGRVAVGVTTVAAAGYAAIKLIKSGISKIKNKNV